MQLVSSRLLSSVTPTGQSDHLSSGTTFDSDHLSQLVPEVTWKGNDPYKTHSKDISAFLVSIANHLAEAGGKLQNREAIHNFWGMEVYSVQVYIVLKYYIALAKVETIELLFIFLFFPLFYVQKKLQALVANTLLPRY